MKTETKDCCALEELDTILFRCFSLEYGTSAFILQYLQCSPQQLLVQSLKAHTVDIFSGMQFVQGTHSTPTVAGHSGPLIDICRQLLRFAPQDPALRSSVVQPFGMTVLYQILYNSRNGLGIELAANLAIVPQGTFMNYHLFEVMLLMIVDNQISPQRQLLFSCGLNWLYCEEGRKGIELRILPRQKEEAFEK